MAAKDPDADGRLGLRSAEASENWRLGSADTFAYAVMIAHQHKAKEVAQVLMEEGFKRYPDDFPRYLENRGLTIVAIRS